MVERPLECCAAFRNRRCVRNFLMTEGADRVMAANGKKKYEKLVALKNKYDPTNFFSQNQNIKPRT